MQLYNRGRASYSRNSSDGTPFNIEPGKFMEVPDEVAEYLLKNYPRFIITSDSAKKDVSRAEAQVRERDEEIKNLKQEIAMLRSVLAQHGVENPVPSILDAITTPANIPAKPRAKPGPKPKVETPKE